MAMLRNCPVSLYIANPHVFYYYCAAPIYRMLLIMIEICRSASRSSFIEFRQIIAVINISKKKSSILFQMKQVTYLLHWVIDGLIADATYY